MNDTTFLNTFIDDIAVTTIFSSHDFVINFV